MEVIKAVPCGYCKGVVRAIHIAIETRKNNPDTPIHILGMLVHNRYVKDALSKRNIISLAEKGKSRLELLEEITDGIVIFSAHGVAEEVYQKAYEKGLTVVDATCDDVIKTKRLIVDYLSRGYEVFYIGVKGHPEAEGVLRTDTKHIHLICTEADIVPLIAESAPCVITNQTTMNINEIKPLVIALQKKYPQAEVMDEICAATRERQEAVKKLNDLDMLYIVGDPQSNNTRNLAKCANRSIKAVRCIETVQDIHTEELHSSYRIGVSAGASTPTALTNQVIDFLNSWQEGSLPPEVTKTIL